MALVNKRHPQALSLWNFIDIYGVVLMLQLHIIILARKILIE